MDYTPSPIDEIVGLLNKYAPADLSRLKSRYPEQSELLESGLIAGDTSEDRHFRVETCMVGLRAAIAVCEDNLPKIKMKLMRSNKFFFVGEIMTVVGSASIFGTLSQDFPKISTYTSAMVALLGALMPQIAKFVGGTIGREGGDLFDLYKELIDCQFEAEHVDNELRPIATHVTNDKSFSRVDGLIIQGNALCKRIRVAVSRL